MTKITDMAVELVADIEHSQHGITLDVAEFDGIKKTITHITSAKGAKKIGKPIGTYCNIEVEKIDQHNTDALVRVLSITIQNFIDASKVAFEKLMVVGLGNARFVADSLGPKTCEAIVPSQTVVTFVPNVLGATGIVSTNAIRAITSAVKPSHVLVVDTLCCHERSRLGNNFQVSNTGITPGSGVGRDNQKLDENFLGVPVIATGVPLVIYQPDLHYVVPKTIDMIVVACSNIIATAMDSLSV